MAEEEKLDPCMERLQGALAAAKDKPTPDSVLELFKAAVGAAEVNPALASALEKVVDEKPVQLLILQIMVKALKKAEKIGISKEEVLEAAEPLVLNEQSHESLINIHALMQVHKALELLLGENYHTPMSIEELLANAGLTREEMTALTPFEAIHRLANAPPPPKGRLLDTIHEAADLFFERRYGWEPGTAKSLTPPQLWLALEHALEDKPNDPKGIWKLSS